MHRLNQLEICRIRMVGYELTNLLKSSTRRIQIYDIYGYGFLEWLLVEFTHVFYQKAGYLYTYSDNCQMGYPHCV